MAARPIDARLAAFDACRRDLFALSYRMLGDVGRAQDMVQEAWLRWWLRTSSSSRRARTSSPSSRACKRARLGAGAA